MPPVVPITDFRRNAARVLAQVKKSRAPVVITQRGRAATVMLSIEAYEQAERERHLSLILETGDREIGMRKGRDLDAVFADADRLLRDAGM